MSAFGRCGSPVTVWVLVLAPLASVSSPMKPSLPARAEGILLIGIFKGGFAKPHFGALFGFAKPHFEGFNSAWPSRILMIGRQVKECLPRPRDSLEVTFK